MSSSATSGPVPCIERDLLPTSTSDDLVLVPATKLEIAQCQRLNADEWKGPLSLQQYQAREEHLFNQDLTKNGGFTGWILVSTALPLNRHGSRQILASCETILANAYIAHGGILDKVLVHGIGSVFTRKEHRGKGYAGRMMTELGKNLETWQQLSGDTGKFSVLYSDIGQSFYAQFGWSPFPSTHISLHSMSPQLYASVSEHLPEVQELTAQDIQRLSASDDVEEELLAQSKRRLNTSFVAIKPDTDHFRWHHAREEFVAAALNKPFPKVKGATHKPTGISIIWNRIFTSDPKQRQLHILHSVIPRQVRDSTEGLKALSALLLRAQREAYDSDMQGGVEVWDPSDAIIAAAQNLRTDANDQVEIMHREKEHVCSLRWVGPGGRNADVVWLYNQNYAWC